MSTYNLVLVEGVGEGQLQFGDQLLVAQHRRRLRRGLAAGLLSAHLSAGVRVRVRCYCYVNANKKEEATYVTYNNILYYQAHSQPNHYYRMQCPYYNNKYYQYILNEVDQRQTHIKY